MVNKLSLDDSNRFYCLGKLISSKFAILYKLEDILTSSYDYVYGYYLDKKLVAFIHVSKMYEVLDIVNIVVDLEYRQKGIAGKLIDYALSQFEDIEKVMLEVNENNEAAINLYLKKNFKVINKRLNYYGNDTALIMKRGV